MTGTAATDEAPPIPAGDTTGRAGRFTALDQARQLLARAHAQKAARAEETARAAEEIRVVEEAAASARMRAAAASADAGVTEGDTSADTRVAKGAHARLGTAAAAGAASALTALPTLDTARSRTVAAPRTTETRVQQALDTASAERALPTLPAVSELLSGTLRGGAVYSVRGSSALVMAMMAGPSAEGAWCGVVGMPSFGAEAARALGVDLERLVLVPDPQHDWLSVVAALVDALTVVVVRPPGEVTPGEASRLSARLRTRGAMLIAVGSWPGSEARLEVQANTWSGLGAGEGHLTARQATIAVTGRGAAVRPQQHHLWLPALDGTIRPVEETATDGTVRPTGDSWLQEAVG